MATKSTDDTRRAWPTDVGLNLHPARHLSGHGTKFVTMLDRNGLIGAGTAWRRGDTFQLGSSFRLPEVSPLPEKLGRVSAAIVLVDQIGVVTTHPDPVLQCRSTFFSRHGRSETRTPRLRCGDVCGLTDDYGLVARFFTRSDEHLRASWIAAPVLNAPGKLHNLGGSEVCGASWHGKEYRRSLLPQVPWPALVLVVPNGDAIPALADSLSALLA